MPYVSDGRILIQRAFRERYAMPAFNVCSLEMATACVEAARLEDAPVILQTYPGDLELASPWVMAGMIRALAEEAPVPVMLHLDHGDGLGLAARCLRAGYASVMFDGASLPAAQNEDLSRRIAELAHACGAACEAAAGTFGGGEGSDDDAVLTEPDAAAQLRRNSGADMIAVSVGSRHGQPSRLDLARLDDIARAVDGPLVLHGGSGIPDADVARAVEQGVVKINIGAALARAVASVWSEAPAEGDAHREVYRAAREALVEVARTKIRVAGGAGRARTAQLP